MPQAALRHPQEHKDPCNDNGNDDRQAAHGPLLVLVGGPLQGRDPGGLHGAVELPDLRGDKPRACRSGRVSRRLPILYLGPGGRRWRPSLCRQPGRHLRQYLGECAEGWSDRRVVAELAANMARIAAEERCRDRLSGLVVERLQLSLPEDWADRGCSFPVSDWGDGNTDRRGRWRDAGSPPIGNGRGGSVR